MGFTIFPRPGEVNAARGWMYYAEKGRQPPMSMLDLELFFNLSQDLLCMINGDGRILRVNAAFQQVLGWTPDQIVDFESLTHQADRHLAAQELRRLRGEVSHGRFESRCLCRDGYWRRVDWALARDSQGPILAAGRDLTSCAQAQERRFRALVEHSTDLVALLDEQASFRYLSPAFETVLGYSASQWMGRSAFELVVTEDIELAQTILGRALGAPGEIIPWQLRVSRPGEGYYWLEGTGVNYLEDPSIGGIVLNCRDISERKRVEDTQRQSTELLARLAQHIPGVIFQYKLLPDGRSYFPFASEAMGAMYGLPPGELTQDASLIFTRLHPDDYQGVLDSIQVSAQELQLWRREYRVLVPGVGLRWHAGQARPDREADGSTLWHGFVTDITERKEAQRALEDSEQRYRVQIEVATEAIVVLDVDLGKFVDANNNALQLFGLSREELLLRGPLEMSPEFQPDGRPSVEAVREDARLAMDGGTPVFEWTHRNAAGTDIPCEVRLVRLPSSTRNLVRGSITDITERKRAEEDLLKKEAAIASSVYGIAMSDLEGNLTYANRAFSQLWGYDHRSEILGRSSISFLGSSKAAENALQTIRQQGAWSGELESHRRDGTSLTVQVNASQFHDSRGKASGMLAST